MCSCRFSLWLAINEKSRNLGCNIDDLSFCLTFLGNSFQKINTNFSSLCLRWDEHIRYGNLDPLCLLKNIWRKILSFFSSRSVYRYGHVRLRYFLHPPWRKSQPPPTFKFVTGHFGYLWHSLLFIHEKIAIRSTWNHILRGRNQPRLWKEQCWTQTRHRNEIARNESR